MSNVRLACAIAAASLLAGCTLGPDFKEPSLFAPATWFASRPPPPKTVSLTAPQPIDPNWWTLFNDPVLTELEQQVAASNLTVRLATIRLAESRYQRGIAAADQFPTLNGNTSYTREKVSDKGVIALLGGSSSSSTATSSNGLGGTVGGIPSPTTVPAFDLYQAGFDASWELDLWGRVRREVESADASVEASAEARRDSLLSTLAEVARDYLQLRGQQRDLAIAKDTLVSDQRSLQLTRARQQGGLSTDLDVSNASAQVATTAAQIPNLEQQVAVTMNALAFLLGETPVR
ncbi:MAG: TolC family protein [Acetobacteraceae bacterium]